MCMDNLAYARTAYKSFPRSARHLMQLIGSHQSPATGWAYLSYACLSEEASLTRRRVIQLVTLLEASGVLEVPEGTWPRPRQLLPDPTGRGRVTHSRKRGKKVKSHTPFPEERVRFPTPQSRKR